MTTSLASMLLLQRARPIAAALALGAALLAAPLGPAATAITAGGSTSGPGVSPAITAADYHACAVLANGRVRVGAPPLPGQLRPPTPASSPSATT